MSIRVMEPFGKSCSSMKLSLACARTSTIALPMPTTSSRSFPMHASMEFCCRDFARAAIQPRLPPVQRCPFAGFGFLGQKRFSLLGRTIPLRPLWREALVGICKDWETLARRMADGYACPRHALGSHESLRANLGTSVPQAAPPSAGALASDLRPALGARNAAAVVARRRPTCLGASARVGRLLAGDHRMDLCRCCSERGSDHHLPAVSSRCHSDHDAAAGPDLRCSGATLVSGPSHSQRAALGGDVVGCCSPNGSDYCTKPTISPALPDTAVLPAL